jgi:hypothetical protein
MDCIFLNRPSSTLQFCHANLIRPSEDIQFYKSTESELKKFCENEDNFCDCPRYEAMQKFHKKSI